MVGLLDRRARTNTPCRGITHCSVIIPVYEEEDNLPILHQRISAAMEPLDILYEIVYVDDGSKDASFARLQEIAAADPHVVVIRFRRNFGQTAALAAGMANSCGDILVFMDADLQNDPVDIPRMLAKIDDGYDVVSGWRVKRQDAALVRKLPSRIANALISKVTGVYLHDYGCTLKAYRREVISEINLYGEMHRFIPAHAASVGANIVELPVQHHPRLYGKSKYNLSRTMKVMLDLLTVKFLGSYSTKPIYVFGGIGLVTLALAILSGIGLLAHVTIQHISFIQSPLLTLTPLLFIVSIQFLLMGLLAEIGVRTYHESQSKPTYVIRQVVRHDPDEVVQAAPGDPIYGRRASDPLGMGAGRREVVAEPEAASQQPIAR